jgi:hypothetical protein
MSPRAHVVSFGTVSALAVLGAAAVMLAPGCGARSGLDATLVEPTTTVPCTNGTITMSRADPAIMLVIDRSGSMGGKLGQTSGLESRWSVLTDGFSTTLPPVDGSMEIGALLYPTAGGQGQEASCSVPGAPDLLPATGNVGPLLALMKATQPGGATPTADALGVAASALDGVRAATTARALVLATDGGPNCNTGLDADTCRCANETMSCHGKSDQCLDDARTEANITSLAKGGLPTYVIGIQDEGDDIFTDVLNAMAVAGGRPQTGAAQQYYAARSPADLDAALVAIRDQVGLCTYLTTSVPDAKGTIEVLLDGTEVPYDATGTTGWVWADESNGEIVLHGATCTTAAAASSTLVAQVKCGGV